MSRRRKVALAVALAFFVLWPLFARMGTGVEVAPATADPSRPTPPRICCAFGYDLRVSHVALLGAAFRPAAWATVGRGGDRTEIGWSWRRMGAHVREGADTVLRRWEELKRLAEVGGSTSVPAAGGRIEVRVSPGSEPDPGSLVAGILYRRAVWHEAMSWLGYETVPGFAETNSSFSPDDLVSDALGLSLGRSLAEETAGDPTDWNLRVDLGLRDLLRSLAALGAEETRRAFDLVAGRWWDPDAVLPDPGLALRRRLGVDSGEKPWRVSGLAECSGIEGRAVPVPDVPPGVDLRFVPADRLREEVGGATLDAEELAGLVSAIGEDMRRVLGPEALEP